MTVTAVTFDFWQTLYRNRPIDVDARLRQMQTDLAQSSGQTFSLDEIKAAVKVARQTWRKTWSTEHRTLTAGEWLTVMLNALGVSISPADQEGIETRMENSLLLDPPDVVEEIPAVLAELSTKYRLAVISDTGITPGRVLRQILAADDLLDYFTQLTFSDEVGYSKPHPNSFLRTLEVLRAAPTSAVHVGDLLRTDILGAKSVGMRGVQYVGVNHDQWSMTTEFAPKTTVEPDAVINHHTELPDLLQQWRNSR